MALPTKAGRSVITLQEFKAQGEQLYGTDFMNWRFRCPSCKTVLDPNDYRGRAKSPEDAYSDCIGRYVKDKGCDWAAYGLFTITTKAVDRGDGSKPVDVFDFADEDKLQREAA